MSDNELDAELLGMVGGESDDEGEELDQTQAFEERSPSQEAKQSVEKAEEAPRRLKGVAQKVRKRRKARKQESEDEDDLGGGSPSPPGSLGSGAMEESDGEIDAPGSPIDEDAPLFPLDGKYLSAQDREDVLALPEVERESLLADRAEQLLKRQQDLQLKKALAAAKNAANNNKRKAAAAELDDGGRRTRPKAEKTKTALDDYKRARELKGTERGRLDTGRGRRDERSPSSAGSGRDADGESEVEWAEPSSDSRHKEEPPAELKDFDRCRVGRSAFAKICFFPGFQDAIQGCFARVSIGPDRSTGQNMYRMTQIKNFTEGKPYQLEGTNGKHFTTDVYAMVAHGGAEKPWPFSACSDSKFTDQELDRYVATLKKESLRVPTKKYLGARLDAIHKLLNLEWTDDHITIKLANQRAMERKFDPANAAKLKREKINKRKLQAEEDGNIDEVMACDAELAALENSAQSTLNGHSNGIKPSPIKKAATGPNAQQERLAQLNVKNRGKNVEEVRKALLVEKRKLQAAREQAAAEARTKAEADAATKQAEAGAAQAKLLAIPRSDMADLFGDSDASKSGTPVPGGTPRRSRAGTPLNGVRKERSGLGVGATVGGPVGALRKRVVEDDVIGSLELDIDVEI